MTFAEALSSADAQCHQQRAAYAAAMSPEQLEAIQRNDSKPGQLAAASLSNGSAATWFTGLSVRMWGSPD